MLNLTTVLHCSVFVPSSSVLLANSTGSFSWLRGAQCPLHHVPAVCPRPTSPPESWGGSLSVFRSLFAREWKTENSLLDNQKRRPIVRGDGLDMIEARKSLVIDKYNCCLLLFVILFPYHVYFAILFNIPLTYFSLSMSPQSADCALPILIKYLNLIDLYFPLFDLFLF